MSVPELHLASLPGEILERILDMAGPKDYRTRANLSLACRDFSLRLRSPTDVCKRALRADRSIDALATLANISKRVITTAALRIEDVVSEKDGIKSTDSASELPSVMRQTGHGILEAFVYPRNSEVGYCITDNDGRVLISYATYECDTFFTNVVFYGSKSKFLARCDDYYKMSFKLAITVNAEGGPIENTYSRIQGESGLFCIPSMACALREALSNDRTIPRPSDMRNDAPVRERKGAWSVEVLREEMTGVMEVMKTLSRKKDPILLELVLSQDTFGDFDAKGMVPNVAPSNGLLKFFLLLPPLSTPPCHM